MSLLIAMLSFSLVMSISPGPINMVIISAGATYGARKTFAFVSGATIGFTLLLIFIGLGFYKVMNLYPFFFKYLALAGTCFIFYLGYVIASSTSELNVQKQKRPSFLQGLFLQWLNPKAWIACASGASLFSSPDNTQLFLIFSLIYFVVCYISLFLWSVLGDKATIFLNSEFRIRLFNRLMGGTLIATACFLLYNQFSN